VVSAYRNHNRPLLNTSFNILFQVEIPKSTLEALLVEGRGEFLNNREIDGIDEGEAMEYASTYAWVALSTLYPWLMAQTQRPPQGVSASSGFVRFGPGSGASRSWILPTWGEYKEQGMTSHPRKRGQRPLVLHVYPTTLHVVSTALVIGTRNCPQPRS
jgi:hypothetical protein